MYRVKRKRKHWRQRWPWRRFFPPVVDERFCQECRRPLQNGPHPKEIDAIHRGNVAALVYPAGNWKPREFVVKVGRWKQSGPNFYLTQYFLRDDVDALFEVASQLHEYVAQRSKRKARW